MNNNYSYQGSLSHESKRQLEHFGFDADVLSSIKIEIGTWKSKLVTRVLSSSATVIGRTIYFRNRIDDDSIEMTAFIAHEVIHIYQWKNDRLFILKYIIQYIYYMFKYLIAYLWGKNYPKNWVHDQISYEKEAIKQQTDILAKYSR